MSEQERFAMDDHAQVAEALSSIRQAALDIRQRLWDVYGRQAGARAMEIVRQIDRLRSELDDRVCEEHPRDDSVLRVYYGGNESPRLPGAECVCLADLPDDPERRRATETQFRKGVTHAFCIASDLVRDGATADDLDVLTDLAMDWRMRKRPGVHTPHDLIPIWQRGERGITGLSLAQGGD